MSLRSHLSVVVMLAVIGSNLQGQATTPATTAEPCDSVKGRALRVCHAAVDGVHMLHPTVGLLISGGNPVLGTAGASGRFGHFELTTRATYATMVFPATDYRGTSDTVARATEVTVLMPRVDLSFGVYRTKLPMGDVAVDLLGSLLLVPTTPNDRVHFGEDVRRLGRFALGFGYGFRAALITTDPAPTVSLSVVKRDLPTTTYGRLGPTDNYAYSFNTSAINVRLGLGRRFGHTEIVAGMGANLLGGDATVLFRAPGDTSFQTAALALSGMRLTLWLNASREIGPFRLSAEGGFQVGKDDLLVTVFEANDPKAGKFYGGLGIGVKL